jgi:hypothetical protein
LKSPFLPRRVEAGLAHHCAAWLGQIRPEFFYFRNLFKNMI